MLSDTLAPALVGGALLALFIVLAQCLVWIPNTKVGVVERLWSPRGSVVTGLIALQDEAGFQPVLLRGGWHAMWPFIYRIHRQPLVTIPQGRLGYVFARDGRALPPAQVLASNAEANDFQDATGFLAAGGQRGPQRQLLREGTYTIHPAQFVVVTAEGVFGMMLDPREAETFENMRKTIALRDGFAPVVIKGNDDVLGVVTVHDGPSLPEGEIIAPIVGQDQNAPNYHNNFQDADRFLTAGHSGGKGRQLQVLVEGTYNINRLFATIELVPKTVIDVGYVGVVVSYTGEAGADLTDQAYRHGELVARGRRGVWSDPLMPGKYAFNTYAGKVVVVPTTNFILKWKRAETGNHRFDENLSEISLITRDAFEPYLPVSVVVHIDYRKAPMVVQRFGDIRRLVEQTLDPMVAAWFKNVGQTRTLIELLQDRSAIQIAAQQEMKQKFSAYNLELQEVLIGTPSGGASDSRIEVLLDQLRARQVAEEQVETYRQQERAAVKQRELREAEARADQQAMLTQSEIRITVQSNEGKADLARAQQESGRIRALAEAESDRARLQGIGEAARIQAMAEAEAARASRVGIAEAIAVEEKVRAYGGPQYQLIQQVMAQLAQSLAESKVDIVPRVQMGGEAGGTFVERTLALMMSERLSALAGESGGEPSAEAQKLRQELLGR